MWVRFIYRGFWDVPREIVVPGTGGSLLLSCPFSEMRDEYPDDYELFWLDEDADLTGSWEQLRTFATASYGQVPVAQVVFDATKRAELDLASLGDAGAALAGRFGASPASGR